MTPRKQIAPTVLDLVTLDRVIGGCRPMSISPAAPPLGADFSAMLLSSAADPMIRDGASGFGLDQVGSLELLFAELESEPLQQHGSFEALGSVADPISPGPEAPSTGEVANVANLDAEQEQPVLHATLDQGAQAEAANAGPADGIHSETLVNANPSRVVNAHVVSAIRNR